MDVCNDKNIFYQSQKIFSKNNYLVIRHIFIWFFDYFLNTSEFGIHKCYILQNFSKIPHILSQYVIFVQIKSLNLFFSGFLQQMKFFFKKTKCYKNFLVYRQLKVWILFKFISIILFFYNFSNLLILIANIFVSFLTRTQTKNSIKEEHVILKI